MRKNDIGFAQNGFPVEPPGALTENSISVGGLLTPRTRTIEQFFFKFTTNVLRYTVSITSILPTVRPFGGTPRTPLGHSESILRVLKNYPQYKMLCIIIST